VARAPKRNLSSSSTIVEAPPRRTVSEQARISEEAEERAANESVDAMVERALKALSN
jgi:hypothetical protein